MRSSHPNAPLSPTVRTRRNTEFPSFPDWANPTALATFCDDLNTLHAADPTTNPATCLAFHSGPWVSVFGLNIDQPGPHLPEGTLWQTWDEGSGTIDITGTRPNHAYVCYIKGNVCPGGIDTAPEGTAVCKTRMALRTTGLPQHLAGLTQHRLCRTARSRLRRPCAHAEQTVHFRCAGDNGCNYGACFNPAQAVDGYRTRCVHDASFCSTTEQYYTAAQVLTPSPAYIRACGFYTFSTDPY